MRKAFSRVPLVAAVVLLTAVTMWAGTGSSNTSTPVNVKIDLKGATDVITIPQLVNYQGKLTDGSGNPVTTPQSMTFKFWDDPAAGNLKWQEVQPAVTPDANGVFNVLLGSVTPIESVPQGGNCWLEITVGAVLISPRTRIVSAAYAYNARRAADIDDDAVTMPKLNQSGATLDQVIKWNGTDWAPGADGIGQDNDWVHGSDSVLYTIRSLGVARGGSGNALLGGMAHTHVNFGVACSTGQIGGSDSFCTVSGGKRNYACSSFATVCGGDRNRALGQYTSVGGGRENRPNGYCATVGGGDDNAPSGGWATVGGGEENTPSGDWATVGGGYDNDPSGDYATVGGGRYNDPTGSYATVGGGYENDPSADYATVGGGRSNGPSGICATVGGGDNNDPSGNYATVAGGMNNVASNTSTTVGGGYGNNPSGLRAVVGGGYNNNASGAHSTVAGGYLCDVVAEYGFAVGYNSDVLGGTYTNSAAFNGTAATAAGQIRCGTISANVKPFTIDHPLDPDGRILNHYSIEYPEILVGYRGTAVVGPSGRVEVSLPDYFDALARNPTVQLTGVGTASVFVAEKVTGNRFVIGGPAGTEVYWTVTAERKDVSAEVARTLMPVEQPKTVGLIGRSMDDDYLVSTMSQLEAMGKAGRFRFRTLEARQRYEDTKRLPDGQDCESNPQPEHHPQPEK